MSRVWLTVLVAFLALAATLGTSLFLHRSALSAVERLIAERLRGAGESAAGLVSPDGLDEGQLVRLRQANALDGAYVLDRTLAIRVDAGGMAEGFTPLLRIDERRARQALAGHPSVGPGYQMGALPVLTGYFPLRTANGQVDGVLALEAGEALSAARAELRQALVGALAASSLAALALATMAFLWSGAERSRRVAAAKAARGEALATVAAVAAHEIRNPLGVIRGTVELMRERLGRSATTRDQEALTDILEEVDRLRKLTDDLLELSAEKPLAQTPVDVLSLVAQAERRFRARFPATALEATVPELPSLRGDAGRLGQVLDNLLVNAAQAAPAGRVRLTAGLVGNTVWLRVADQGPGVPPELEQRLFEPFATGKSTGTGLGLPLARKIVEGHGGTLELVAARAPGAVFELRLPSDVEEVA
jgi:two-component system, OmpR family, sensor kinase